MSNQSPNRAAAGTPEGGRFSPSSRPESSIDLPDVDDGLAADDPAADEAMPSRTAPGVGCTNMVDDDGDDPVVGCSIEDQLCYDCKVADYAERSAEYANYSRPPQAPSREDWDDVYSDNPAKRASYDSFFG